MGDVQWDKAGRRSRGRQANAEERSKARKADVQREGGREEEKGDRQAVGCAMVKEWKDQVTRRGMWWREK